MNLILSPENVQVEAVYLDNKKQADAVLGSFSCVAGENVQGWLELLLKLPDGTLALGDNDEPLTKRFYGMVRWEKRKE